MTILISSHILGELSKLATRYGIINDCVLVEEFTEQELSERCKASLIVKVNDVVKACEILKMGAGIQWDKELVRKFIIIAPSLATNI